MSSVSLHSRWGQREELLDMERCSVSPGQSRRRGWSIRRDQSSPECLEWLLAGAGPKSCLFCLKTQPELQGHSGRAPASPFPIKPGEADGCSLCPAGMPRDGPCCSTGIPSCLGNGFAGTTGTPKLHSTTKDGAIPSRDGILA